MMSAMDASFSIGDLARLTGLPVKTIRFYSDRGIVPPAGRSPAGYRRYGLDAVARLDLVRTLRELGLDLPTIRRVAERESSLASVAAAHADALATQIRTLRLRHAVLTAVARRGSSPKEMALMHRLAGLSEGERRRLVDEFLDTVFGRGDADPALAGIRSSMTPALPDDAEAAQVEAWIELAELSQEPGFRAAVRRMVEQVAADRADGGGTVVRRDATALVRDEVRPALAAGIDPASPAAEPIVAAVTGRYARLLGRPDDLGLRRRLLSRVEAASDPRRERYLRLLSTVNGWAAGPGESVGPALTWFVRALRPRLP
jgi:DNA-binding transcriptional MerR regulator